MSKQKVAARNPCSLSYLKLAIEKLWIKEITLEYCEKLCISMPERIQNVLKNKGFHTNIKLSQRVNK